MKAKTIKAVLQKKFDDFCESITDEELREHIQKNSVITGGCIASMLLREDINDFDVYFRDYDTALGVAQYYVNQFNLNQSATFKGSGEPIQVRVEQASDRIKIVVKSTGIASEEGADDYQYFEQLDEAQATEAGEYVERVMNVAGKIEDSAEDEKPKYRPIFITSNCITLSHKVQLVLRFYGEPDKIHETYDFVHCMNYWTSWDKELVLRPEALEALLTKELRYVGSMYPLCSIIRTRKFLQRNWTINAGQYLKMAMQLNQLDLTDIKVLEDQLIGVDVAYFMEILNTLKEKNNVKVDSAYLMEIIDRMF